MAELSPDVRLSKFLSRVLRHDPGLIGLRLDRGGWAPVNELLERANAAGRRITREDLERVVATSSKQRFRLSEDSLRIRASQGHSIEIDLGLCPKAPPARLYHGTAARHLSTILTEGLKPQRRLHVHLSTDPAAALMVGRRHGPPVVLAVAAGALYAQGHPFWQADNGVWLTSEVPPVYLAQVPGSSPPPIEI